MNERLPGDPSAEVVDVVKLNIHHPVSVSLGENFYKTSQNFVTQLGTKYLGIYLTNVDMFIVYKTENTVRYFSHLTHS